MKKSPIIFCLLIGLCMLGMWSFLLISGNVTELKTEPIRISLHLASEFLTAVLLILSGIGKLLKKRYSSVVFKVSLGLLMYSVINAAGYYAQQSNIPMVIMFTVILLFNLFFAAKELKMLL